MPDIALLAPIALPLLGAGTLLLLGGSSRRRTRDPLPALIAGAVFAAAVVLAERAPVQTDMLPWPALRVLGGRPAILVDDVTLVFVFALTLLAIASTIAGDHLNGRQWAMAILLWGGSLGIVISANLVTLILSWALCELALIGASLLTRQSRLLGYRTAIGGAGMVVLVLLAMRAGSHPSVDLSSFLAALSPRWVTAFFAAGAIRMALFPLHLAGVADTDAPLAPLVLGRLASATAGLYLWFRAFAAMRGLPAQAEYLVVVGGIAALASALAAWGARSQRAFLPWLVGYELGVVVVALGFTAPEPSVFAVLEMLNLLLAGSVFGLSLHVADGLEGRWARTWVRGLRLVALASLLGLPPTAGFVSRWGLFRLAVEIGDLPAVLPMAVATGLLVPAILAATHVDPGRPVPPVPGHAVVGLTILGLPLLLVSAQPLFLTPLLDIVTNARSYVILAPLVRSASTLLSAQVILLILVPVLVGFSLERVHDRWRAQGRLGSLWRFIALEWLYDVLASTVLRAAIAVSILLTFLELGSTLGWIVIGGLLVMLFALRR